MISAKRLGLAGGILMAFCMLVTTLISMNADDQMTVPMMMPMFHGWELTGGDGFIIGLILSFVHGFIALFLLGWIYNHLPHSKKK